MEISKEEPFNPILQGEFFVNLVELPSHKVPDDVSTR